MQYEMEYIMRPMADPIIIPDVYESCDVDIQPGNHLINRALREKERVSSVRQRSRLLWAVPDWPCMGLSSKG